MKTCKTCGTSQPLSEFPSEPRKGGRYYHPQCRGCRSRKRFNSGGKCRHCGGLKHRGWLSPWCSDECRVYSKTTIDPDTGCWLWNGAMHGKYGVMSQNKPGVKQRNTGAHRRSYEIFVGPIPIGMMILHLCHTPRCVNPEHLRPGTGTENNATQRRRNLPGQSNDRAAAIRRWRGLAE